MDDLSLWVAFIGGVVSFASPCVLPLMPGYLGYISGISAEEAEDISRRTYMMHTLLHALIFGVGFTTVFVAMGLTATSIGSFLVGNLHILQRVAGVLLIFFGLHMMGLLRLSWFYKERRVEVKSREATVFRSYLLGMAFGFGWTPCVGPILGGVLTMAASQDQVLSGGLLLFVYSLGMGLPFMITAVALTFSLSFASRTGKFLHYLHIVAGAIMFVMGALLLSGYFQKVVLFFTAFTA